jgi:peptide/nickel transport system substrate-binding protein
MKKLSSVLAISALAAGISMTADAAKHEQGGVLTVPLIADTFVEDFNPLNGVQADMVSGTMYEPLWIFNSIQGDIDYRLAESFSYGDDKKSLTIKLRSGLKWSDGQTLDADDLLFSFNQGKDDAKLDHTGQWANGVIASVEKVDGTTVKVNFNDVNTTVDWYLPSLWVVPQHVFESVEDRILFKNPNPVGSGPITEVKAAGSNQVEICRNPHYYKADQGLPYLDCIKFRQYSDNSQILPALMNDEIDWGSNFVADIDKTYVETNPETHGYWYPANDLWNMYLNTRIAPFNDINFRKAFSTAIDRPTMVDLAAYGYPTAEETVVGLGEFHAAAQSKKINKKFSKLAEYNPKESKKILKKAGYKDVDGDGYLENPDGSAIDFEIMIPAGWTDVVQMVQMTTEYLADIGIQSSVKLVDWSGYDSALKEGTYDVVFNWSATNQVSPINAYREYYHPARVGQIWHAGHGMASDELGALVDEYGQIDDAKRRQEILDELMTFTAENLPFVAVMSNATWFQYNTTRVDGFPTEKDPYVRPVFYDGGTKLMVFERLYAK